METNKEIERIIDDYEWEQAKIFKWGNLRCVLKENDKCWKKECDHVNCDYIRKKVFREIFDGNYLLEGFEYE